MELSQYYDTDVQTGEIVSPKAFPRRMASETTPKGCPECRKSLRDINRYNRIVKRALLDEATRRFVAHANSTFAGLVKEIEMREALMEDEQSAFLQDWTHAVGEAKTARQMIESIEAYQIKGIRLLQAINQFTKSVTREEQPFGKVNNLIKAAVAKQQDSKPEAFGFDESVIETGFQFRAKCLTLRLNWDIVLDLHGIYSNSSIDSRIRSVLRDAVAARVKGLPNTCQSLTTACQNAKFPQQEAEARIYYALFSMLALRNSMARGEEISPDTSDSTHERALSSLAQVEDLISQYPGSLAYLKNDTEKATRFVMGGTFYSVVTSEERREVYRAMAEQFSGTGHWYYCENNHPVRLFSFTSGVI